MTEPSQLMKAMISYLDCPCRYFAPTLDDDEIVSAYEEAVERGKEQGFIPILVTEDDTLWECLIMNSNREDDGGDDFEFDPKQVAAYRKEALNRDIPQGKEVTARLLKTRQEESEEDEMDWDEEILGEIAGGEKLDGFLGYWNYSSKATSPLILAEIPVKHPWEIFAYLPFGGWNECPDTADLMAVSKYWHELYGAVPAVITHDTLEFLLPAPVSRESALQLALEHYAWCPDVVDQGGADATVGTLADGLAKSKNWYFWWD